MGELPFNEDVERDICLCRHGFVDVSFKFQNWSPNDTLYYLDIYKTISSNTGNKFSFITYKEFAENPSFRVSVPWRQSYDYNSSSVVFAWGLKNITYTADGNLQEALAQNIAGVVPVTNIKNAPYSQAIEVDLDMPPYKIKK